MSPRSSERNEGLNLRMCDEAVLCRFVRGSLCGASGDGALVGCPVPCGARGLLWRESALKSDAAQALLVHVSNGCAKWFVGDSNQTAERRIHFQDEEHGAAHGQRAYKQHDDDQRVARCQQTKAHENEGLPNHQDGKKRDGNRGLIVDDRSPARKEQRFGNVDGFGLQSTLGIIGWDQTADGFGNFFGFDKR